MSLRTLEFTLPYPGPAGAHVALDAMLHGYGYAPYHVTNQQTESIYRVKCKPDDDKAIAFFAMSVFPVNHVQFLDVDAGVHFALQREHRRRTTGDDR